MSEKLTLKPIDPNFHQYESKDFFNLIVIIKFLVYFRNLLLNFSTFKGPLKVYSSENEMSIPFSCILRKQPHQQTFGITVKGDCPVRVNQVDPKSFAYVILFLLRKNSFIN